MKRKRRRKKKKEKKNCGKKTSPLSIDQGSWVVKTKTARFDSDERRTLYSGGVKRKENRTL
jgi:predicted small secreted protein